MQVDSTFGLCDAHGTIHEMPDLSWAAGHVHVFMRDVFEQGDEIDLLLIVATEGGPALLPDDGYHRLVIELRVVETIEKMDGAGS